MTQSTTEVQVALVTGASRGLGLEFCKQLLAHKYKVIATCRNPSKATDLNELKLKNSELLIIETLDVTNDTQIKQLSEKYSNKPIDLLILNAGIMS